MILYTAPTPFSCHDGPVSVLHAMNTVPSSAKAALLNTLLHVLNFHLNAPVARSTAVWNMERGGGVERGDGQIGGCTGRWKDRMDRVLV